MKDGRHPTIMAKQRRSNQRRNGRGTHDVLLLTDGRLSDTPKSHKNPISIDALSELNSSSNGHEHYNCGQGEHECETNFALETEFGFVKHVQGKAYDWEWKVSN